MVAPAVEVEGPEAGPDRRLRGQGRGKALAECLHMLLPSLLILCEKRDLGRPNRTGGICLVDDLNAIGILARCFLQRPADWRSITLHRNATVEVLIERNHCSTPEVGRGPMTINPLR